MPQYPVPQFIESEGKIISFLTYKQFFILVAGGAICFAFFFFTPFIVFLFGSFLTATIFGLVAFYKINNMSIVTVVLNAFGFLMGSKNYTWKKNEATYPLKMRPRPEVKVLPEAPKMQAHASKLREIQQKVETRK